MKRLLPFIIGVLSAFISPAIHAQNSLSLGLATSYKPVYLGSDDNELSLLPAINARVGDFFQLNGTNARLNVIRTDLYDGMNLKLGPVARYRFKRDADDSNDLNGMGDVDGGLEAGLGLTLSRGAFSFDSKALTDLSGNHDGTLWENALTYKTGIANTVGVDFKSSLNWASEDYTQTFYGVTSRQSTNSGHRTYDPEGGFKDFGLAISLRTEIPNPIEGANNFGVQLTTGYDWLLGDAKDSPLAKEDGAFSSMFVVAYPF